MGRFDEAATRLHRRAREPGNPDRGRRSTTSASRSRRRAAPARPSRRTRRRSRREEYAGKGKASANLGLAYAALGRPADAVAAFETPRARTGTRSPGAALDAYEAAKRAVGTAPKRETVEGWRTGELPPVPVDRRGARGRGGDVRGPGDRRGRRGPGVLHAHRQGDEGARPRDAPRRSARSAAPRANPWARAAAVAALVVVVVGGSARRVLRGLRLPDAEHDRHRHARRVQGRPDGHRVLGRRSRRRRRQGDGDHPAELLRARAIDGVERAAFDVEGRPSPSSSRRARRCATRSRSSREGVGWKVIGIDNDWGSSGGS